MYIYYIIQWEKLILISVWCKNHCENRFSDSRRISSPAGRSTSMMLCRDPLLLWKRLASWCVFPKFYDVYMKLSNIYITLIFCTVWGRQVQASKNPGSEGAQLPEKNLKMQKKLRSGKKKKKKENHIERTGTKWKIII